MRHMTKRVLTALACLSLIPTTAMAAREVRGPHQGTVTATTYYSSGMFHGAVDVSSGEGCNYWGVQTSVVGSLYWNVTVNTTSTYCYGSGADNANEARHVWADGWVFRLRHWHKTAASVDKTCDRCQIGDEGDSGQVNGPTTHLQQDKNGTLDTSWYSGYTLRGEAVSRTETLGYLE